MSVLDDRFEWIGKPIFVGSWRYDVSVPGKTEHWSGAAATGPKICHIAELHRFACKAEWRQTVGQDLLATRIIRRYRWAPDELS
jgi:hypothetical protein